MAGDNHYGVRVRWLRVMPRVCRFLRCSPCRHYTRLHPAVDAASGGGPAGWVSHLRETSSLMIYTVGASGSVFTRQQQGAISSSCSVNTLTPQAALGTPPTSPSTRSLATAIQTSAHQFSIGNRGCVSPGVDRASPPLPPHLPSANSGLHSRSLDAIKDPLKPPLTRRTLGQRLVDGD